MNSVNEIEGTKAKIICGRFSNFECVILNCEYEKEKNWDRIRRFFNVILYNDEEFNISIPVRVFEGNIEIYGEKDPDFLSFKKTSSKFYNTPVICFINND